MKYARLIAQFVLARTLIRTDILSAVVSAIMPAMFFLSGREMPADLAVTISLWIASSIAVVLLVRLLAAPYVIWTRDQSEIARLADELEAPTRKNRIEFQTHFIKERAELAKQLARFVSLEMIFGQFHTVNIDAELRPISTRAYIFLPDPSFRMYWTSFCAALRRAHMGAKFAFDHEAEVTPTLAAEIRERAAYDIAAMSASARAMMNALVGEDDHFQIYELEIEMIARDFDHLDKEREPSDRWKLPPPQSPSDIEARTPH